MTDTLSDAFRANVRRIMRERGIKNHHLSIQMGAHPTLVRMQMYRTGTVTLATVARYSEALGIPAAELITPRDAAMAGRMIDAA